MHDHDASHDASHDTSRDTDHEVQPDSREIDSRDRTHLHDQPAPRIHRVCVTCNNMFETDPSHLDVKYCPACRRA